METMTMEIKLITTEQANALVASKAATGKYQPLGKFLQEHRDGTFSAYDNANGECYVEDFPSREGAVDWLTIEGVPIPNTAEYKDYYDATPVTYDWLSKELYQVSCFLSEVGAGYAYYDATVAEPGRVLDVQLKVLASESPDWNSSITMTELLSKLEQAINHGADAQLWATCRTTHDEVEIIDNPFPVTE